METNLILLDFLHLLKQKKTLSNYKVDLSVEYFKIKTFKVKSDRVS
jgi:hypothetical protein